MASKLLEGWLEQPGQGVALMAELDELVVAELEHGVEAMVGARDLLERLKAQGTPIGLVSNSPLIFVRRSLEIVGFESIFDIVVSAHEVAEPKPAPDPYLEACKRLGVEPGPNVIALEDSPTGVAAARAAGLTVIGVPSVEGVELLEAHHIAANLLDEVVLGLTLGTLTLKSRVTHPSDSAALFLRFCSDFATQGPDFTIQVVDLLLGVLEPLRERANPPLEPLDVARRGQIEGAEGRLLGLERPIAGAEGGLQRAVEGGAVDQCLGDLADRLLGAGAEAVAIRHLIAVLAVIIRAQGQSNLFNSLTAA